jgi:hypothetical protein
VILFSGSNPAWGCIIFYFFTVTIEGKQTTILAVSIVTKPSFDFDWKEPRVKTGCIIIIIIIIIMYFPFNSYVLRFGDKADFGS